MANKNRAWARRQSYKLWLPGFGSLSLLGFRQIAPLGPLGVIEDALELRGFRQVF